MESIIIIVGLLEFRSFMSIALGMPVLPNTQNMSLWLNKSDEPEYKRRNVGKGADLHTFFSQENTPLWTSLYFVRVSKVKCIQGSLNIAVLRPNGKKKEFTHGSINMPREGYPYWFPRINWGQFARIIHSAHAHKKVHTTWIDCKHGPLALPRTSCDVMSSQRYIHGRTWHVM